MRKASIMWFRANSLLLNWNRFVSLCRGLVYEGRVYGFSRTVIFCGDIRTDMVKHEICLLTWAYSHFGHVNNTEMANEKSHRSLSITHSFSVTSANIAINDISLFVKNFIFWTSFLLQTVWVCLQPLCRNWPRIRWNNPYKRHYAVQGHSRSPILVPVESSCATCY